MCVHIPVTVHQPLNQGRPLFDRSAQIHLRNVPSPVQAQVTPGLLHPCTTNSVGSAPTTT